MSTAQSISEAPAALPPEPAAGVSAETLTFEGVYDSWFDFVWRNVRRLGVADSSVDDVVQEVFLVVHRKLPSFEQRSTVKTWLYGILRRVVSDYHRTIRRKRPHESLETEVRSNDRGPAEQTEQAEAARVLHEILMTLDEKKREIFILVELEGMTAPEIADVTGINLNTVYARVRAARKEFNEAVERYRLREGRRNAWTK